MRALLSLLALLLFLGLAPAPLRAEHAYEGVRLRVRGDVPEAWIDTAVALVESLYPALAEHFGRSPDPEELPLRLVIHPDRGAYSRALKKAGVRVPLGHSGGFTFWKEGVSHVYLQKDDFHSRRLILHELAHQFHAKCRPPTRRGRGAWWYREGLAEYYGWHRRTKEGVVFGRVHPLTRTGTAPEARACVQQSDFSAWRVLTGVQDAGYAQALAVVAALLDGPDEDLRARFRAWEGEILERGGDSEAFARRFAGTAERLEAAVRAFWLDKKLTWAARGGAWAREQGGIVARAGLSPAILMRVGGVQPVGGAQAQLRVQVALEAESKASAGLLLQVGETALAAVVDGRRMVLLVRASGPGARWREVGGRAFTGNGPFSLSLALAPSSRPAGRGEPGRGEPGRREIVFRAQADGSASLLRLPCEQAGLPGPEHRGRPGLFVRHGKATFRDFGVGPMPK